MDQQTNVNIRLSRGKECIYSCRASSSYHFAPCVWLCRRHRAEWPRCTFADSSASCLKLDALSTRLTCTERLLRLLANARQSRWCAVMHTSGVFVHWYYTIVAGRPFRITYILVSLQCPSMPWLTRPYASSRHCSTSTSSDLYTVTLSLPTVAMGRMVRP